MPGRHHPSVPQALPRGRLTPKATARARPSRQEGRAGGHQEVMRALSVTSPGAAGRACRPVGRCRETPMTARLDRESQRWLRDLGDRGAAHDDAVGRLHALLFRALRFEVARRRPALAHLRGNDLDDIAMEAADDALVSVLRRLGDYRGLSRFTHGAYKFALLEAAVKPRRRARQAREVPLEPEGWALLPSGQHTPHEDAEQAQVLWR